MGHERDPVEGVLPVRPEEIAEIKKETIPPEVIQTINHLIAENYARGRAVLKQKDLVAALREAGVDTREAFRRGWMDFEPVYETAGWEVEYDRPGYNEMYEAHYIFTAPG